MLNMNEVNTLRRAAGLTLAQLAERSELSLALISTVVRGMTPSAKSMAKIERALKSALAEKAEAVERAKQTLTAA